MKGIGLIALLISLVIVAVLVMKQRKTAVNSTIVAPSGKEVKINEVPTEVKNELDNLSKQAEKRIEEGHNQE